MTSDGKKTKEELLSAIEDLRIRLEEAEETLRAIRAGEVDGLVVSGSEGEQLFILKGEESAYRAFVETMNEGAVTLSRDGTILYCNDRFAELVNTTHEKVIGRSIYAYIASADAFESAFLTGKESGSKAEILLKREDNEPVPVSVSFKPLLGEEVPGICMVVTDLTEHMRAHEALQESETKLKYLASKLLAAQEEERKRIAGDIHDGLGSSLAQIRYKVDGVLETVGAQSGPEVTEPLKSIIPVIQESMDECRRLQMDLRPPMLDDLGILATLSWLCRRFQTTYPGIHVEQKISLMEEDVPDLLKIVIFRITQEAMNNVAKYSKAKLVSLSLNSESKRIELAVTDNGIGFNVEEMLARERFRRGLGLESMRERTEISGGSFTIQSGEDQGTVIRASWSPKPQYS